MSEGRTVTPIDELGVLRKDMPYSHGQMNTHHMSVCGLDPAVFNLIVLFLL